MRADHISAWQAMSWAAHELVSHWVHDIVLLRPMQMLSAHCGPQAPEHTQVS